MRGELCKLGLVCVCVFFARLAAAQSIVVSPAAPTAADTVVVTFSQPFNCTAQQPRLTAHSANSFTFDTLLPDGVVHCPLILSPPPVASNFPVILGALSPGTYTVTWTIRLNQSSGMPILLSTASASLVVTPGDVAGITISPGFTGNWFNHDQSGHGFSIEVLADNQMLAEWFVFAPNGGQAWIIATGPITGNTAVLRGFFPAGTGGRFPPNFDSTNLPDYPWGTIIFTFTDCDTGQVSWQPSVEGYTSGSMAITRLTLPAGLTCP